MFYTVNNNNGMIIDASYVCPNPQEQADYFGCPVYIIEGQHTGLCADPTDQAQCPICGAKEHCVHRDN